MKKKHLYWSNSYTRGAKVWWNRPSGESRCSRGSSGEGHRGSSARSRRPRRARREREGRREERAGRRQASSAPKMAVARGVARRARARGRGGRASIMWPDGRAPLSGMGLRWAPTAVSDKFLSRWITLKQSEQWGNSLSAASILDYTYVSTINQFLSILASWWNSR